jgi:threonine aldolase
LKKTIDLRSDTVTKPTKGMRQAMAGADVGDDVYGEDPTVNRLENMVAERAGMNAGLFVPSGTQGNLLAILAHCERGDEYIAGQQAHCYRFEGGGAAVLGGVQPQPVDFAPDGRLDLTDIKTMIKPLNDHFAVTRLVCLENTQAGKVLPLDYQAQVHRFATEHGLALHLDGARVLNASVAQQVPLATITARYHSATICLSKGLGAPVGSVLVGNSQLIAKARRWRKMAGGGMRQAGILAAAGIYALDNHVERLADDHVRAARLADGLANLGYAVNLAEVQTNMVFVDTPASMHEPLIAHLRQEGILAGGYERLRLVTHLDVTDEDIDKTLKAFQAFQFVSFA